MAHITTAETSKGTVYNVHWRPQAGRFAKKRFYMKRGAERFRDKVERELSEGQSTQQHVTRGMQFRDVAERMPEAERPRLKQKTIDGYEIAFRANQEHLRPRLGGQRGDAVEREGAGEGGFVHDHELTRAERGPSALVDLPPLRGVLRRDGPLQHRTARADRASGPASATPGNDEALMRVVSHQGFRPWAVGRTCIRAEALSARKYRFLRG